MNNDVAVLELAQRVPFDRYKCPAYLPTVSDHLDDLSGTDLMVTGWGVSSSGTALSRTMMKAAVRLVSVQECRASYDGTGFLSHPASRGAGTGMLCTRAPGRDACAGDGGGPLVLRKGRHKEEEEEEEEEEEDREGKEASNLDLTTQFGDLISPSRVGGPPGKLRRRQATESSQDNSNKKEKKKHGKRDDS